jgi:hypothetical protein
MSTAISPKLESLRALPTDAIRQTQWGFADRYDLQMLVQSARGVARGPVARLVAQGGRNSHEWTTAKPRHLKGLSTCCYGEEPHVAGWRFINERRAVNLDPNCGWARGKADVLYVADAFDVMKEVNALLAAAGEAKRAATAD